MFGICNIRDLTFVLLKPTSFFYYFLWDLMCQIKILFFRFYGLICNFFGRKVQEYIFFDPNFKCTNIYAIFLIKKRWGPWPPQKKIFWGTNLKIKKNFSIFLNKNLGGAWPPTSPFLGLSLSLHMMLSI